MNEKMAETIKTMRLSRNLSQEQLANMIGKKRSTIANYESGTREPDLETLEALADVFNVPLSAIIAPDEKPDADVWEIREALRKNPELQILFRASHNATAEDLLEAAELIKARKTIRDITNRK